MILQWHDTGLIFRLLLLLWLILNVLRDPYVRKPKTIDMYVLKPNNLTTYKGGNKKPFFVDEAER